MSPSIDLVADLTGRVIAEVERAVVGKRALLEQLMAAILASGHVLLEDYPGLAKTLIANSFATALGLEFKRIQFTPDLLPGDITGGYIYDRARGDFELRRGPLFANVILADEINRAATKTQSALLEAMEEKEVTVEGTPFKLQEPFLVIATINPVEHEGVYTLPEAQLDRFMIKGLMDYLPSEEELRFLDLKNRKWRAREHVPLSEDIFSIMVKEIENCRADISILTYIRDIIQETRVDDQIILGGSPRAGEQVLYASKAAATIAGRNYVLPDDVKNVVRKMVPHRITLSLDSELEGISPESVVERILDRVEVVKQQGA